MPPTYEQLMEFYRAVARLTLDHRIKDDDLAWVSPADLGDELEKINKEWWKDIQPKDTSHGSNETIR